MKEKCPTDVTQGRLVQAIRKGLAMSLEDFADAIGYNHSYVRQVESGLAHASKRFENQIDVLLLKKKLGKILETP